MPSIPSPAPDLLQALESAIAQQRGTDPLIGCKLGSQVALDLLLEELKTDRGVHAETLCALSGSLIGRSTQAALWEEARKAGHQRIPGLQVVQCGDGSCLLTGDPLNRRLVEGLESPWCVLSEAARQEGCTQLPDGKSLLLEGLQRMGTREFGTPQVPPTHRPQKLPAAREWEFWKLVEALCRHCCADPEEWPLLCSLLAVRALRLVKTHIHPALAFRLVMDPAIDAAKLPLADFGIPAGTEGREGSVP